MAKNERKSECERKAYHSMEFAEVNTIKELITNELKDAIQNGTIVIAKVQISFLK